MSPPTPNSCARARRSRISCAPTASSSAPRASGRGRSCGRSTGRSFLHAGPGYGGSCCPKDCLALVRTAQEAKAPLSIIETVVGVNEKRKRDMADKVIQACGGSVKGKTLALLGLTFKPNTDDMRD